MVMNRKARRLIRAAEARDRLGGISDVTLWRWRHDPLLGFPGAIIIRGNVYFDAAELDAWVEAQREVKE